MGTAVSIVAKGAEVGADRTGVDSSQNPEPEDVEKRRDRLRQELIVVAGCRPAAGVWAVEGPIRMRSRFRRSERRF